MSRSCFWLAILLGVGACKDNSPVCSPDAETADCFCANGRRGVRRCNERGRNYGVCICPPEDAGDVIADAPDVTDDVITDAPDVTDVPDAGVDVPDAGVDVPDAGVDAPAVDVPATTG